MKRTTRLKLLLLPLVGLLAYELLKPLAIVNEAGRLHRATQMVRLALTEHYASEGVWAKAEDLGVKADVPFSLLPNGVMQVGIAIPYYKIASIIYYRPEYHGVHVQWVCVIADPALRVIEDSFPNCNFEPTFQPLLYVFDMASEPKQTVASADSDPCKATADAPALTRPQQELEARAFTLTHLGDDAYLLLGWTSNVKLPIPAVWNERTRALYAMDPFWNAQHHTATPVGARRVLIAGGQASGRYNNAPSDRVLLVAPCTRTLVARGTLLAPRMEHIAVRLDDHRVLIAGGRRGDTSLADAEIFDIDSMKSTAAAPMVTARKAAHAVVLHDRRVMVIGGDDQPVPSVELYDPVADNWTTTGALSAERRSEHFSANVLPDGRVLVAGGEMLRQGLRLSAAELWDPATGIWRQSAAMLTGHARHESTVLPDGRVLIVGGASGIFSEIYYPAHDAWVLGPTRPPAYHEDDTCDLPIQERLILSAVTVCDQRMRLDAPRVAKGLQVWRTSSAPTVLPDGRLLIAGGRLNGDLLRHAEVYDPATDTSVDTGSLHAPREEHRSFLLPDGDVVVFGGKGSWTDDMGQLEQQKAVPAERWSRATGRWTVLSGLTLTPEQAGKAVLLPDGDIVYFVKGEPQPDNAPPAPNAVMRWRHLRDESEEQGRLLFPRSNFVAGAVAGGRILIAGGDEWINANFTRAATSSELWDIDQRKSMPEEKPPGSSSSGDRHEARPLLQQLPDGRVLVVGAHGSTFYDPKANQWSTGPANLRAERELFWVARENYLVRMRRRMGFLPEVVMFDAVLGTSRALDSPKGQCVEDAVITNNLELIMFTDHCGPDPPKMLERRRLVVEKATSP